MKCQSSIANKMLTLISTLLIIVTFGVPLPAQEVAKEADSKTKLKGLLDAGGC